MIYTNMGKEPYQINDLRHYLESNGAVMSHNGVLVIPKNLGNGYFKWIKPSSEISLMLQNYTLHKSIRIRRNQQNTTEKDSIIFCFRQVFSGNRTEKKESVISFSSSLLPSVQVSTPDMVLDIEIYPLIETQNLIVEIKKKYLKTMLGLDENSKLVNHFFQGRHSFLYEEISSPKIHSVATEIFDADSDLLLPNYFFRIKTEELIFLFFNQLLEREKTTHYPLHQKDMKIVYAIRDLLTKDIESHPKMDELASKANMSMSKLGKIFKQVFGKSMYSYYQQMRMLHAAFLLREKKLSVSEVGYQIGFSNLSHFSRLFKKHIGVNPKQYSRTYNNTLLNN